MTQILIVDDQEQNRYLLQIVLRGHGYEVQSASNGIEALEIARRTAPDLIITDILMPGMDGFALCRAWLADETLRKVPLVFYTATYTDPQDEALALNLGAARFIVKPAEPDAFIEIVRQVLANHAAQRLAPPEKPQPADEPFYQQYSEALVRKLEHKMAQLEAANRALERDIAERVRAEAELHRINRFLDTIIENIPNMVFLKDAKELRFVRLNRAGEHLLGFPHEEMLGKNDYDFFPRREADFFIQQDHRTLQDRVVVDVPEETVQTRFHGRRILHTKKVPILNANGEAEYLLGISEDITERRQGEAERERLLAQVQAQAEQIAQIMDTVPEGVLLLNADGQVLVANPAGARDLAALAGVAVGEQLTHLGDLSLAEMWSAGARRGPWHEVRAGQQIFEVIARPVSADGGPAAGHWVLIINDVTQACDLRNQLQQQERLAAVGQLTAGIAHDFNNILAIIALQAPLIAHAPGLTDHDRERLAIISEQIGYATRLVQQLLDFSRRAVLERRPLDLGPLLREQVKLLARTLPETIRVTLDCAPGEYVVLADPTRLQQMLMNLAVNARDAMLAGGTLRLTLARQETAPRPDLPPGPWVRLTVADSGAGIAPEIQAHIFEPFFTTKPRGQGTGLGLAQVHGIVKQHEGEITVHSTPGEGATFTIYLPAAAEAAPAPAPAAAAPQAGAQQLILIVEDNPALLDAMSDTVELLGYRVLGAGNGVEALAVLAARGAAIALVLSDLIMPVMGGEALFRAMRARGLSTPVVILSGHPLEDELAGVKAQGLAGWLLKPPNVDDLARLLAQTLASQ